MMREIDAQRTAVSWEFLYVDHFKAVPMGQRDNREKRKVGKVLVINGVELITFNLFQ